MDWTDSLMAKLTVLWGEGHSTAEIARRMNLSKNAIVGKAHRMGLPPRPSPIIRDGGGMARNPKAPARVGAKATLAPLSSVGPSARVPPTPQPPRYQTGLHPCCWPSGDPGTPSFRFCNAKSIVGRPYCEEHAKIAYARAGDTVEDAP